MRPTRHGFSSVAVAVILLPLLAEGCASGGSYSGALPPSITGTHTVMGRAVFPGGTMVLVEAHLKDGEARGRVEYSQVQSRREITLRVFVDVECVGIFGEGARAFVTGPVSRVDGDYEGRIGPRDWWFVQIEEGGGAGDLILSSRIQRTDALSLCHEGPRQAATLRAVDGDLSIH